MSKAVHYNIILTGAVQGVGLRYSASRKARALGIYGLVRNESDGSVSVEAEGEPAAVAEFLLWLDKGFAYPGPHTLRTEAGSNKGFQSFEILFEKN
jgi:acylphosphatase